MNSDNTAPLPQPTRYTCRNCGFGWNEPSQFCPRCGAAQNPTAQSPLSVGVQIAYSCGLIVFGGLGACLGFIGFMGGAHDGTSILNPFTFIGAALLAASVFLFWMLVRGGRS